MSKELDPTVVATLKAQHGEVFSIEKCGQPIVYRACNAEELDQFIALSEKDRAQACIGLVSACVVHPSRVEFEQFRQKRPGILYGERGLVTEIQAASGMAEKETSVKL